MKRTPATLPASKPRNLLHDAPLLRKGGVHEKPHKAQRRQQKIALRREWDAPWVAAAIYGAFHSALNAV